MLSCAELLLVHVVCVVGGCVQVACARQLDRAPVFRGLVDTLASSYVRLVRCYSPRRQSHVGSRQLVDTLSVFVDVDLQVMLRQSETVTVPAKSVSTIIQEQGIR